MCGRRSCPVEVTPEMATLLTLWSLRKSARPRASAPSSSASTQSRKDFLSKIQKLSECLVASFTTLKTPFQRALKVSQSFRLHQTRLDTIPNQYKRLVNIYICDDAAADTYVGEFLQSR